MTEKDFRKLITDLETTKESKDAILEEINKLNIILKNNVKHFNVNIEGLYLADSWGLHYEGQKELTVLLTAECLNEKNFPLSNQGLINEVYNSLLYGLDILKKSQIGYNELDNSIYVYDGEVKVNLVLRFNKELEFQTDYFVSYDNLKDKFIKKASSEFNLFKNTIILIKSVVDENNIPLGAYEIALLLYYGLSINFTNHTYAVYIKEFIHAVDDFLKGVKIDQDDDTYRELGITRALTVKKGYTIVDVSNPSLNLTANVGEAFTSDLKKLKKILQKMLDN